MRWLWLVGITGCESVQIVLLEDPACALASTYVENDADLSPIGLDLDSVDAIDAISCDTFDSDYRDAWAQIHVNVEAIGTIDVPSPYTFGYDTEVSLIWPVLAICTFAPTDDFWVVDLCTAVPAGPPWTPDTR